MTKIYIINSKFVKWRLRNVTILLVFKNFLLSVLEPIMSIGDLQVGETAKVELSEYLKKGQKVLDIGCGSGVAGKAISDKFGVKVTGVDVQKSLKVEIPFFLIDGKSLPFANKSFDHVLIFYVFHHTESTSEIIEEAKRVSENYIFVLEDTPLNSFQRFICSLHGHAFGYLYDLKDRFGFRSKDEWVKFFVKHGLKIEKIKTIGYFNPIYSTPRTLFVLTRRSTS
jgi:SAM-dependent methyltransferase